MTSARTKFEIDGCKGYQDIDGQDYLVVESDKLEQYITCSAQQNIKRVVLAEEFGYKLNTLDFTEQLPFLEGIKIAESCNIKDFSPLYKLTDIVYLSLPKNKYPLDFSYFPKLSELIITWNTKYKNLEKCTKIKWLWIVSFNTRSQDFRDIPSFRNLQHLTIVWSNVSSFQGLALQPVLKQIDLEYCAKLVSLEGLEITKNSLLHLQINNSKKLKNHSFVCNFDKLEVLRLNSCGDIGNINFLNQMPNLKSFSFVDTNVIDGDLTPLFNLESVGFLNKRHYSHTDLEVDEIISKKKANKANSADAKSRAAD